MYYAKSVNELVGNLCIFIQSISQLVRCHLSCIMIATLVEYNVWFTVVLLLEHYPVYIPWWSVSSVSMFCCMKTSWVTILSGL